MTTPSLDRLSGWLTGRSLECGEELPFVEEAIKPLLSSRSTVPRLLSQHGISPLVRTRIEAARGEGLALAQTSSCLG